MLVRVPWPRWARWEKRGKTGAVGPWECGNSHLGLPSAFQCGEKPLPWGFFPPFSLEREGRKQQIHPAGWARGVGGSWDLGGFPGKQSRSLHSQESQESREDSSTSPSESRGIRAAKIPGKQHLRDLVLADLVEAELGEVQDLLPVILCLPGDQQIRDLWEKREWKPRELPENPRKAELVPSFPGNPREAELPPSL